VAEDTLRVKKHFETILKNWRKDYLPVRFAAIRERAGVIDSFYSKVVCNQKRLHHYVSEINKLDLGQAWWSHIAQPSLSHLWEH
jgi:hypothetical protein